MVMDGREAHLALLDDGPDGLSPHDREAIGAIWAARAEHELGAGAVFEAIGVALGERRTAPEVRTLVARAVQDERRHSELCRRLAARYLSVEVPSPSSPAVTLPVFGDAPTELNATLNVVLNSCISETVAVEFLRVCRAEARGPAVRDALRSLLADEMRHARLGWAHLQSSEVSSSERREVGRALPILARMARAAWTTPTLLDTPAATGHGWLDVARLGSLFDEVMSDVVVPGLAHVGVELRKSD